MKEKINEILAKYYDATQEYYSVNREVDGDEDVLITDELKELFDNSGVKYKLSKMEAYRSVAYDSDVLALSWVENDELEMITILLESF